MTALDLPSPNGVVVYRLHEPADETQLKIQAGVREFDSIYNDVSVDVINISKTAYGHAQLVLESPYNTGTGQSGDAVFE